MKTEHKTQPVIPMVPVTSSQIAAIGHDEETSTLAIQFTSKTGEGSIYHYSNFSAAQFIEFRDSESVGAYFGKMIKPNAEQFPFVKIEKAKEAMTAQALAALLNGREYREEITKEEVKIAAESGLVAVFGYSDDGMEFVGAIDEQVGCYNGGTAYLTSAGLLTNDCGSDDCPHFSKMKAKAATIEAIFDKDGYTWVYETAIPHETFEIVDDGEKFCRGIVFAMADVKVVA
jgi:hypothetical protein